MKKVKIIKYSTFLKMTQSKQKEILHIITIEERRCLMALLATEIVQSYPRTSIYIQYGK